MKSVLRKASLPALLEKLHPEARTREVIIQEPEDGSTPVKAFLSAVRKAHRDDCILVPPGEYPAPPAVRQLTIKALRPGTVLLRGVAGKPALTVQEDVCIWLNGVVLMPGSSEDTGVRQTAGCLILSNCQISGGIEVSGKAATLFCESTLIDRAEIGISLSAGARAEIMGSTVSGCHVGISAGQDSTVDLLHSRIEGSSGEHEENPGAGLHADKAAVYCAGTLFVENQIGAHVLECKGATFLFCLFEGQSVGGFMMSQGGTLTMHQCSFREQASASYAHVTLENVTATLDYCRFDESAGLDVEAKGGHLSRRNPSGTSPAADGEVLQAILADIRQSIGMNESKEIMENILHQAHAVVQRRERGLPVPPLKFHCIFEGPEGCDRTHAARLLSKAFQQLGILERRDDGLIVEAAMEDLLLGSRSIPDVAGSARGKMLILHAPVQLDRRDTRMSFNRAREILRQMLAACGQETILIFSGSRDSVRPVLCNSTEMEEMFRSTIHFSPPSPPEIAQMFTALAAAQNIRLTTKAKIKVLLSLHMMHDRRDRRFLNASGVAKLLDAAQKRYYERCSRERNFELEMEAGDLDVPVEKLADAALKAQPAFVAICPKCGGENPWVPGLGEPVRCADCDQAWDAGWGVWLGSSFFRKLTSKGDDLMPAALPPLRKRTPLAV